MRSSKSDTGNRVNVRVTRTYLFWCIGISHSLKSGYLSPLFLLSENRTWRHPKIQEKSRGKRLIYITMLQIEKRKHCGAMESGNHLKNGAGSKSQMSRGYREILSLFLSLCILVASGLVVISCGGGDDGEDDWMEDGGQGGSEQTFRISYGKIGFPGDANDQNVSVQCNGHWTATSNASWCTVSPNEGNGNSDVIVSVEKNPVESEQNTTILFQSASGSKSLKISQSAGTLEACAPSSLCGTITTLTVSFRYPYTMEKVKVEAYNPSRGKWVTINDKISGSVTSYAISPYRDYVTEPVQYGIAKVRVSGYMKGKWGPTKTVVFDIGWGTVYEE